MCERDLRRPRRVYGGDLCLDGSGPTSVLHESGAPPRAESEISLTAPIGWFSRILVPQHFLDTLPQRSLSKKKHLNGSHTHPEHRNYEILRICGTNIPDLIRPLDGFCETFQITEEIYRVGLIFCVGPISVVGCPPRGGTLHVKQKSDRSRPTA